MRTFFTSLWQDESGQAAAEYGLILALVAVVIVTGLTALGSAIDTKLSGIATTITSASAGGG